MNTEQRVLAMLNKVQNVRLSKKENLGAIEDAIKNELDNLDSKAQDYIQQSQSLYSAIEEFFNTRDSLVSKLSQASDIDMNAVYELIDAYDEAKTYTEVDAQTYLSLVDIESLVDASAQIINGLESVSTPGIG